MAFIIKDRVKEGTTSTGTGAITLGGSAATFDTFQSYMINGDTTYYAIVHTSSGVDEWEVGIGTWNTGNTLTRTTVLAGSNGTSAENFSAGIKDVFMTYPASKAVYTDANGDIDINGGTIDGTTIGATAAATGKFTTLETTGNADIGGYIDLEVLSAHPAHREGRVFYDSLHKTLNFYSDDTHVVHEIGIEEHQRVYNDTGSTILKGKPLYFSGNYTAGSIDVPTVGLADATDVNAYNAQGLAASDIPNNSYGYCIIAGQLDGFDTSGLTAGTNFFVGLTPGAVQNSSPLYPNFPMCLGWVVNSDATDGTVLVNQQNHSVNSFRVRTSAHVGADLQVDGNLTVLGSTTSVSTNDVTAGAPFYRANEGDAIGEAGTTFSGTGLDDAFFAGHFTGTTPTTYYVKIDGVGTGTGGVDTFAWSIDNFVTSAATGVDITGDPQLIHSADNISVTFSSTTGHTLNDQWNGTASPINVDSGFFTNYNTGTSGVGYTHTGFYYDASEGKWVLLSEYDPVPAGAIDLSDSSVSYAALKAGSFEGNLVGSVTGDVTGTATSATALATARNIGGVSFNGTANIDLPGVNTTGNQDTTGNAATATALATARNISLAGDVTGNANFDGTGNISITAVVQDDSHSHVISNVDGLQTALDGKTTTARTISAGSGLTGGGDLTANRTISHADTSTQASLTALTGAAVVSDIDVDTYGHVTGLATRNITLANLGYTGETNATADQTITAGSGLSGGGTGNVTLSHSDTSSQASVNNSGTTVIQDVTLDTYGHVTGLASKAMTLADLGYTGATNANYITNNNQLTNGAGYITLNEVPANNGIVEGDTTVTVVDNGSDGKVVVRVDNQDSTEITNNYIKVPSGTTAERPANPPLGSMRYNTQIGFFETFTVSGWGSIASPPVITSISPTVFNGEIGESFTINGAFFDSGSTVKFVGNNGLEYTSGTVQFIGATQLIATNGVNLPVANEPFKIRVINGAGLQAESSAGIDAGTVPAFSTSSGNVITTSRWDQTASTTLQASDAENQIASYSVVQGSLPNGYSLNSATGVISGTGQNGPTTTYTFTVEVTDSAGNANTRQFNIQVNNAPPVWSSPASGSTLNFTQTVNSSVSLSASDPEGQSVSYSSLSSLPSGLILTGNTITGTPSGAVSNTAVTLRASDGYSFADRPFFINVGPQLQLRNGDTYTYRASSENFTFAGYTVKSVNLTRSDNSTYAGFVVESLAEEDAWLVGHITNAVKAGGGGSPWNPITNMQGQTGGFRVGNFSGWNSIRNSSRVILMGQGGHAAYNWNVTLNSPPKTIVDNLGTNNTSSGSSSTGSATDPNYFTGSYGGTLYERGGSSSVTSDNQGSSAYVHLYGKNSSSDSDESVMAFTSSRGDSNGWGDSWRGDGQIGTCWSLWNDDYGNLSWPSTGQGGPGRSTSASTGTDNYIVAYC